MKKVSIMLMAALMLFAFAACDDDSPAPGKEIASYSGEELVTNLDHEKGSLAFADDKVTVTKEGAYYEGKLAEGKTYVVSYDLTISGNGSVAFNHNLTGGSHFCQAYTVFTAGEDGVTAEVRPETSLAGVTEMGAIKDGKVTVTAAYTADSVTVSFNGQSAAVNTEKDATGIFWCISAVDGAVVTIDNFSVVEK